MQAQRADTVKHDHLAGIPRVGPVEILPVVALLRTEVA